MPRLNQQLFFKLLLFLLLVSAGSVLCFYRYRTNSVKRKTVGNPSETLTNRAVQSNKTNQASVAEAYAKLPLSFEENSGQTDSQVKFLSRGDGYALFLTSDGATLSLRKPKTGKPKASSSEGSMSALETSDRVADVIGMHLVGADHGAQAVGEGELSGKSNYFTSNDPSNWRTAISTFEKVRYQNIYPGIDLVYYGNQRQLEYDFTVAPGTDAGIIKVNFQGVRALALNDEGDLVLKAQESEVRLHKPISYQLINGERREVPSSYEINGRNEIGFKIGGYDRSRPLIIDPVLIYSTYLGGSSAVEETATGIAVDVAGNAYITGTTTSTDFPLANAYKTSGGGFSDVFVSKLNSAGTMLLYSTYLGGNRDDHGNGIALDVQGACSRQL